MWLLLLPLLLLLPPLPLLLLVVAPCGTARCTAVTHGTAAARPRRLTEELIQTAHNDKINDLAFPHEYSEVFATAGVGYIRVWHLATCRELLRITVPNLECHCVTFLPVRRPGWWRPCRGSRGCDAAALCCLCSTCVPLSLRICTHPRTHTHTHAGCPGARAEREEHRQRVERWQDPRVCAPERQDPVHHPRRAPQGRHVHRAHVRQLQGVCRAMCGSVRKQPLVPLLAPFEGHCFCTCTPPHTRPTAPAAAAQLISGGGEGMLRVWRLNKDSQVLEASMKDHKGSVNSIQVKRDDSECVSASSDGSCIIWDLGTFKRRTSLFANTFFKSVVYHPDESQLVTTGTDRKVRARAHLQGARGAARAQGAALACLGRALPHPP